MIPLIKAQSVLHTWHPKENALELPSYPFTCDACEALQHGKSSQLLHKLQRASKLKHPLSEQTRAKNSGVSHKNCSKEHLRSALQNRKLKNNLQSKKILSVSKANEKLLSDGW